jgi:hypothetical protein
VENQKVFNKLIAKPIKINRKNCVKLLRKMGGLNADLGNKVFNFKFCCNLIDLRNSNLRKQNSK